MANDTDIGVLRRALQAQLRPIKGLTPYDKLRGSTQLDCAIVFPKPPPGGQFEIASGGLRKYYFDVVLHLALQGEEALARAQDRMDGYISPTGPKSVQAAVLADQTLGGVAKLAVAFAFSRPQFRKLNDKNTLMTSIPIEVTT